MSFSPFVKAAGGGSGLASGSLILLETQIVSADTSNVIFDAELDGDNDGIYKLEWMWNPPATADADLKLLLNGTAWTGDTVWIRTTVGSVKLPDDTTDFIVGRTEYNDEDMHHGSAIFHPATGKARLLAGDEGFSGTTKLWSIRHFGATASDTDTNITSIGFSCAASGIKDGSFFKLYKQGNF